MAFTDVAPPVSGAAKTGISFSVSAGKKANTARLSFNKDAQSEVFGGPIAGMRFRAKVGRGQDEGRLLVIPDESGDLAATSSMHGSASIKMKAWDLLPKGKVPAGAVELIEEAHGGFLFRLPSWAKPTGVGGQMERDHALKRPERNAR